MLHNQTPSTTASLLQRCLPRTNCGSRALGAAILTIVNPLAFWVGNAASIERSQGHSPRLYSILENTAVLAIIASWVIGGMLCCYGPPPHNRENELREAQPEAPPLPDVEIVSPRPGPRR